VGVSECEARAAARGLPPLRWPPGFPVESYSFEPLRAITAAIAHGREEALARLLFERNFVAGKGFRRAGAVRACWVQVGLESASYDAEVAAAKPILASETSRAITEGVYGVPTVTVGDTHFWGDDQLEAAAAALTTARATSSGAPRATLP
jgi:2-hydroxychromene-2-carboxylate isomerase